ncbi:hypothetical protein JG687_00016138 [Phytophthora cactorum]|uniref:Myb-like domain-containing protein n=1 Tax=Phytophthora cactorum TaxID=29920 RepID=A0A8T1TU33_9STRA|nr:hypothetical protein PC120_g20510 [Phytophthora cactorum]KAG3069006.1 hypothetical protein PC121_g9983 [Phytophthora cactorum]KAG4042684.1 hypothetical protein PC123_g21830 [Phytophthora cactorum]KAG6947371.1 hypothetical protein JG687_00016138 [Phytophthora cactorum]
MNEGRHRNFTEEEDLALLRQALGDRPFRQPRGGILAKWDALAATFVADQNFPRESLSGKTASGRCDKLAKAHREHVAAAGLLVSGVSEEEDEKTTLLDEIIALIDDHATCLAAVKDNELRKREREEEASLASRRLAMETLSESSEGSPPKKRKETELKELLISLKEQEMADRKATRENKNDKKIMRMLVVRARMRARTC